ncbi:MAG TPA: rod shape-determining protein MreC [Acidimicrobiia bacterium]|jgi:rod shape-determining protein MreC
MAVYRQDRRRRITLVMLIITSLVLITLDQQGAGVIGTIRSGAQDVISPLQRLADDAISPVTDFFDGLGRGDELQKENARLRSENAELKGQVAAAQAAIADVAELRKSLDLPNIADYDGVFANVVDGSTGNFERTFQIDKGSDAGIAKEMAVVVGDQGGALVGKVSEVSKTRATVQRVDDPGFQVVVQLLAKDAAGGLGPVGLARGQQDSTLLTLQLSDTSAKVDKGQYSVTKGGEASPFPRGLVVGTVARNIDPSTAAAERAALKPAVDLDQLSIVKVLRYRPAIP